MAKYLILIILLIANNSYSSNDYTNKLIEISKDRIEEFHKQCLEKKIEIACFSLGKFYELTQEDEKASQFFRSSCALQNPYACLLGGYAEERLGRKTLANDIYLLGCSMNSGGESCSAIGNTYRENNKNTEALDYYKKGCEKKYGQACFFAYEVSYNEDSDKKNNLLKKGCILKHLGSCSTLAWIAEQNGDFSTARTAYKEACLMEDAEACESFKRVNNGGMVENFIKKTKPHLLKISEIIKKTIESLMPLE